MSNTCEKFSISICTVKTGTPRWSMEYGFSRYKQLSDIPLIFNNEVMDFGGRELVIGSRTVTD